MPKLSTPFSHIRSLVKPKDETKNPFITALSHQDNDQVLIKKAPQLKEWPTFTREGEYHHIWYYGIRKTNGKNTWSWWKQERITKWANHALRYKIENAFENSFFDPDKDTPLTWFLKQKCGGELEHALRRRFIEPCSTEEYINSLEDIVTRTKIGRPWKELDIKISNKPREPFKPNTFNSNEQRKCHKCEGVGRLANNCLKKAKINEIVETEEHNDKEEESYSEKDNEGSETSESDEINIINAQINNIDLIYEVLNFNSNLPQVGTSCTSLTNIQEAKLYRPKPEKGIRYIAGKSSISIVMVENQEAKVNLYTGAYCTCFGKCYMKTIVTDWEEKLIQIKGVKFSSDSESMNPLGIIDSALIFPHPLQYIRLKVEFVVLNNCTSNHFILGNVYLSFYGIDISNQKDRYFTIGDNKRQKFGFLDNKKNKVI
ncbi:hypothetical protein O181_125359, partial [Austropuccinia psidii MF-1]|nr:hypothetical protein [Austropuccinia psidii MF-1]